MPSSCKWLRSEKLGCNEWWGGWGIYSPNHQKWPLGGCLFDGAPDSPVPPPRHHCRWILTVGASDFWARPDIYCSLSGAPVWARLTSARAQRALNAPQRAVGAEIVVAPWLHRTVRCTPDSPVNYSGAAAARSRGWRVLEVALPWSTGHCPVYTGQSGEL
jgi:hypothetical protein